MPRRNVRILAFAAFIVFAVLFLPPVCGLANNGDFGKIALRYNLYSPQEDEYLFAPSRYHFTVARHWDSEFHSSEEVFVRAMLWLRDPGEGEWIDVRWLGTLHAAVLLLALAIALAAAGSGLLPRAAMLLLLFFDASLLTHLHSLYMDTAVLLGLLLAAACWLRWEQTHSHWLLAGYVAAALLASQAKAQHFLLAVPLALPLLNLPRRPAAALAVLLIAPAVYRLRAVQPDYAAIPAFNLAFYEIAPLADNPRAAIAELGFDESWARWIGTHTYSPGGRMNSQDFAMEVSRRAPQWRIGVYLLRHPRTAAVILLSHMGEAGRIRVGNLGNYDRSSGMPSSKTRLMSVWSSMKSAVFDLHGGRYLACTLLLAALLLWRQWQTPLRPAAVTLTCCMFLALAIGAFGDSLEVTRHLTVFNTLFDMTLAGLIASYDFSRARLHHHP